MSAATRKTSPVGDIDKMEMLGRAKEILLCNTIFLAILDDKYFVKTIESSVENSDGSINRAAKPGDDEIDAMALEISMTEMAEDCAFQPLGRVRLNGIVVGYVSPLGVSVGRIPQYYFQRETLIDTSFTLPPAKTIIEDLVQLIHRLHSKGVIHGDVKPSNLLYSKESSKLLFCDFGSARPTTYKGSPTPYTVIYSTPSRAGQILSHSGPTTKSDDLYATAITIWQIAVGSEDPFPDIDWDYAEDIVSGGFQPNLYQIKDVAVRQLIKSLLEETPQQVTPTSVPGACVTAATCYTDCLVDPPHTYIKIVHRGRCGGQTGCDPTFLYHAPTPLSHQENIRCDKCIK